MRTITVEVNIGPITSTKNSLRYFTYEVKDVNDKILLKSIKASIKRLNLAANNFMAGFISVVEDNKEIFHAPIIKCGDKFNYKEI